MSRISRARFLGTLTNPLRITAVLVTESGEVYLGLNPRPRPLIGEIRRKRIVHRDVQRGFIEEGESVLNYKILAFVQEAFIQQLALSLGAKQALCPGLCWVSVHGD